MPYATTAQVSLRKARTATQMRSSLDALTRLVAVIGSSSKSVLSEGVDEMAAALRPLGYVAWTIEDDTLALQAGYRVAGGLALRTLSPSHPLAEPLLAAIRLRRVQHIELGAPEAMGQLAPWLPMLTRDMRAVSIIPAVHGAEVLAVIAFFHAVEVDEEVVRFLHIAATTIGLGLASQRARDAEVLRSAELAETARLAALGVLSVTVAHELRGPAGALALLVPELQQLLAANTGREGVDGLLVDMRACVDQITQLCGQLRGLGHHDAAPQPFRLDELVAQVVGVARVHARGTGVSIEAMPAEATVVGRRDQIGQVVLNLVLNAIDACTEHARSDKRVVVTIETEEGRAIVEVADNGPGVSTEAVERIFKPFFTTKPRGKGTGLGLSISRDIVLAHRGHLEVATSPLGGALFRVVLPRGEQPPRSAAASRRKLDGADLPMPVASGVGLRVAPRTTPSPTYVETRPSVLLVDDDTLLLRTLRRVLKGYDVTIASTVDQAVAALAGAKRASRRFDVVVTDINMPDGGGIHLHGWLAAANMNPTANLVFLSGGALSSGDAEYVRATGCLCLSKPLAAEALVEAVDSIARADVEPQSAPLTLGPRR